MNLRSSRLVPILIAAGTIGIVCLVQTWIHVASFSAQRIDSKGNPKPLPFEVCQRLELMTYDWRMRQALRYSDTNASNLGIVALTDESIEVVQDGTLGFRYGLSWPRQVYGLMLKELTAQGAKAVAFDILFGELRKDHPPFVLPDETLQESDAYFADQIRRAGNVILAGHPEVFPHPLFLTNVTVGDVSDDKDFDGITRRIKAFRDIRVWHPVLRNFARANKLDLTRSQVEPEKIALYLNDGTYFDTLLLDKQGYFTFPDPEGENGTLRAKPFIDHRLWHLGIMMAARELQLDLANAAVQPDRNRIILKGSNQVQRILPIDSEGFLFVNWTMKHDHPGLAKQRIEQVILAGKEREKLRIVPPFWKDKVVIVGSTATGNNLTDVGATPLEKNTFLVSKYWNVANTVITNRFITEAGLGVKLLLIFLLGVVAVYFNVRLRVLAASFWVLTTTVLFVALSLTFFIRQRYLLPIIFPVVGGLGLTHICLVTYRVIFEQNERKRVKAVFSKIVSPNVVNELLQSEKLSLGGARRKITVYFADVRGFTEMTDNTQFRAEDYVREKKLDPEAAEAHYEEQARQMLETVNLYLATIADTVKKHNGTLDKYIGDCVMAFWGAPTPNEHHARDCVLAAVEAQRAMYTLNQERFAENKRREEQNPARIAAGESALPPLPLLSLGSGINSGVAIVGLMGSDAHILNYTVFGREVNLASRLEGVSGRGRIIIGESTYLELKRDDPALAETCVAQAPVMVKGIRGAVKIYEVPWKVQEPPAKPTPGQPSISIDAPPAQVES